MKYIFGFFEVFVLFLVIGTAGFGRLCSLIVNDFTEIEKKKCIFFQRKRNSIS